ncbi:hypothetical protein FQN60_016376 [Etheostoma spectabile]|uniref:Uncharacterized protein n=1 Tax=Etheostoma spectabile TaxID=54343 RepID=A0A5J5D2D9_9PERO|nr:hypothetical protein FQN60_016376 [Etheostoma spectabile]
MWVPVLAATSTGDESNYTMGGDYCHMEAATGMQLQDHPWFMCPR